MAQNGTKHNFHVKEAIVYDRWCNVLGNVIDPPKGRVEIPSKLPKTLALYRLGNGADAYFRYGEKPFGGRKNWFHCKEWETSRTPSMSFTSFITLTILVLTAAGGWFDPPCTTEPEGRCTLGQAGIMVRRKSDGTPFTHGIDYAYVYNSKCDQIGKYTYPLNGAEITSQLPYVIIIKERGHDGHPEQMIFEYAGGTYTDFECKEVYSTESLGMPNYALRCKKDFDCSQK
ncbi:hypothetical protein OQA88_985 [Cercophora sp. LCS_1]